MVLPLSDPYPIRLHPYFRDEGHASDECWVSFAFYQGMVPSFFFFLFFGLKPVDDCIDPMIYKVTIT